MVSTRYLAEKELNLPTLVTTWPRRCRQADAECPHDRRAERAERGLGHIHRPSIDALMPSLCKPEKHGKHTPERNESRRTMLTARNVRGQLDDLIIKRPGSCACCGKRTQSRYSSGKSARPSHGSKKQPCYSDRISLPGRPTQLCVGVHSHYPSPLLLAQKQTRTREESSQVHPSGSHHKNPWPVPVLRSEPTSHPAPPQPHPRRVEPGPLVLPATWKPSGGPAQVLLRPEKHPRRRVVARQW